MRCVAEAFTRDRLSPPCPSWPIFFFFFPPQHLPAAARLSMAPFVRRNLRIRLGFHAKEDRNDGFKEKEGALRSIREPPPPPHPPTLTFSSLSRLGVKKSAGRNRPCFQVTGPHRLRRPAFKGILERARHRGRHLCCTDTPK